MEKGNKEWFDNINHSWLQENVPMDKRIMNAILIIVMSIEVRQSKRFYI